MISLSDKPESVYSDAPESPDAPFITISRQAGAGGHALAHAILREMIARRGDPLWDDWSIFDSSFCGEMFQRLRLRVPLTSLLNEDYRSPLTDFGFSAFGNRQSQSEALQKVTGTLRALAARGKVIIVGRGAVCATAGLAGGIHLRLTAPLTVRLGRMRTMLKTSNQVARRIIAQRDALRGRFLHEYYGRDINDPLLYHSVWNTHLTPPERIAPIVLEMVRASVAAMRLAAAVG